MVGEDESIMVYDSTVKGGLGKEGKQTYHTKNRLTYKSIHIWRAEQGPQAALRIESVNGRNFLKFLKGMKRKFKRSPLFLDKSPTGRVR